ncbi:META domain-containing protein [Novosphingobium sp. JCM 18896]|uniref:META domain-containing protein n=1 Tax=Novosphingobium sp. JCM 18896 TaxID=2989731 RepID=UPI002222AA69|nr:META domain-containing protein [Novosphingobium sp. JCM 18896]MCW1431603.1 META domain-containing protein [Novosphingobium sp. JCM 18896]
MKQLSSPSIGLAAAILAGCSPTSDPVPPQNSRSDASGTPASTAAPPAFEGRWIITAFDGKPSASAPEGNRRPTDLSIMPSNYGANAGCNSLFGIAVFHEGRYYTQPGPPTLLSCGEIVNAQEAVLSRVMRASPAVIFAGDSGATLQGGGHSLSLRRVSDDKAPVTNAAPMLKGKRIELLAVDGRYLPQSRQITSSFIDFDDEEWRATADCGTLSGTWRQSGWVIEASSKSASKDCGADSVIDAGIRSALSSHARFSMGPNGEFIMAGSGHWISGAYVAPE